MLDSHRTRGGSSRTPEASHARRVVVHDDGIVGAASAMASVRMMYRCE
jgi:hypothetical protein